MRRAVSGMWSLMMAGDRSSEWKRETERGGWWLGGGGGVGGWAVGIRKGERRRGKRRDEEERGHFSHFRKKG